MSLECYIFLGINFVGWEGWELLMYYRLAKYGSTISIIQQIGAGELQVQGQLGQ